MTRRLIAPAGVGLAIVILVAAAGYVPTRRLAGEPGLTAMLTGCAVGLLANWIGLLVLGATDSGEPRDFLQAVLLSTGIRFLAVLGLGLIVALSGWVSKTPLLIWTGVSYVIALATETVWLVRWGRSTARR
jgi:hypothetical protein